MGELITALQNLFAIGDFFAHISEIWGIILASLENSYGGLFKK